MIVLRLFIAVDIDNEIREKLSEVVTTFKGLKGVKPVEKENIHITMKFLGEVDENKTKKVINLLNTVGYERFTITLKGIGFFPNVSRMRVVWVGVEEGAKNLSELANIIEERMQKVGFKREGRFVAHATVARIKHIDSTAKNSLIKKLQRFEHAEFGKMEVNHFSLKKSTLTPKGPIYEDLKVFDLGQTDKL